MTVDEILKQDGKLFKLRKNPFYKKPYKNYNENEPLSKLRHNVKNKKLNAKPTKKELKKSTFDENEPLSKLRRREKLRKNPYYKKPSIAERQKEVSPAQAQLRKLDINDKPLYKKFPKLIVRKF